MTPPGLALGIAPFATAADTVRYARQAEEVGLHGFWLGEGYHGRSAVPLITAAALATRRLTVGLSVISIFTRHPALIAMEAATIDEIAGGRFVLGLGINTSALLKHGHVSDAGHLKDARPVAAMRDAIQIIRGLLGGERVTHIGKVFRIAPPGDTLTFHGFQARPDLPIYVGTRSPHLLRLAGELADGLIITRALAVCPSYLRWCIEEVATGARRVGRDPREVVIAANVNLSVDDDRQRALDVLRPVIAFYMGDPYVDAAGLIRQFTGIPEAAIAPVRDAVRREGLAAGARLVTEEMIEALAIGGTPEECVKRLQGLREAGLAIAMAFDVVGPDPVRAIELLGTAVAPRLAE